MKVISIGRGTDCQVVFDEPTISRRHAILKIYPWGKMELVDMGQNGTFVNGVKLSSNVPYPVSRKDVISFAHVRQLDWNMIPDPLRFVKWGMLAALVVALLVGAVVFFKSCNDEPVQPEPEPPMTTQSGNNPAEKEPEATENVKDKPAENVEPQKTPRLKDLPVKKKKKVEDKKEKEEDKKKEEENKKETEEKPKEQTPVYF